jgi:hypothetical protein
MVLMIDNPQKGIVNLGVGIFPYLMGMFNFFPPSNDVKFVSAYPDHPKDVILQVALFQMSYFNDLWTLPSLSTSMEGVGNPSMVMPLSEAKVVYNIVQQTSKNSNPTPPQEMNHVLEPI